VGLATSPPDPVPPGAETLDAVTTRVLAPNAGPMTLDGTNTYLVGAPGCGEVVCVDPGPAVDGHRLAVEHAATARDAEVVAVVLTHHHADHAEAAVWADGWGVPVLAAQPERIGVAAAPLADGQVVDRAGAVLEVVATPGHTGDHLCFRTRTTGVLLTGDHVLGRGTTVVAWPDGDMRRYVASLERVAALDASALYPGHGPVVDRPREVVAGYLSHRRDREEQILAALGEGPSTPAELVRQVYTDVPEALHPVAERTVRAHLAAMVHGGRVRTDGDRFTR
jgi:glyoxylase-like metal-dependent hydrolase (beta-lactamase superfamily II)